MKKYLFILAAILITVTSFAQEGKKNKKQRKADHFSVSLATKYELDDAKTKKVYKLKLKQINDIAALTEKKKVGEVTPEETKAEIQKVNKAFNTEMMKLCNATDKKAFYSDLKSINQELREVQ